MAITALLHTDGLDRRDTDRRSIANESTLRQSNGVPRSVVLHDLSMDGCQIEGPSNLKRGDTISIGLPGVGRHITKVIWVAGSRTGCKFESPLTGAQFLAAFSGTTVINGAFQPSDQLEEPVQKWHPAVRLTLMVGLASALWSAILHIA